MHNKLPSVLFQGWTGINHSYSLVNQYQILEFSKLSKVSIYKEQVPFPNLHWNSINTNSGFDIEELYAIGNVAEYTNQKIDITYRIYSPNNLELTNSKIFTFIVTEFGLNKNHFTKNSNLLNYQKAGNKIITPSTWSKKQIIEYGFDSENVLVVPHGVDCNKFYKLDTERKLEIRRLFGYGVNDTVFLNIGAPIWNKGIDILIEAFFMLRRTCKNAKLIIKDQKQLYGKETIRLIEDLEKQGRITIDKDILRSILILPNTMSISEIRNLYNVADFYVSPYRAEGFNLPVIEAIACGTKVIVTEGGSTDDFCSINTSIKIPSKLYKNKLVNNEFMTAYLSPDIYSLVQILKECCTTKAFTSTFEKEQKNIIKHFSWKNVAQILLSKMV